MMVDSIRFLFLQRNLVVCVTIILLYYYQLRIEPIGVINFILVKAKFFF